ncbi:hypothetical protein COO91_06221 [Nostoc flagelliforme CCNUN1]|uniref:Uncharacterized protein n=1 Tax=Nostoc flagelliforme CCNUN1 TaxID=2038116 RepID=A0A2K8SZM3_9NOSO|nr:hypothetical protein COO91_06221 [Nostoc flagelliforme CCNUN1]
MSPGSGLIFLSEPLLYKKEEEESPEELMIISPESLMS